MLCVSRTVNVFVNTLLVSQNRECPGFPYVQLVFEVLYSESIPLEAHEFFPLVFPPIVVNMPFLAVVGGASGHRQRD